MQRPIHYATARLCARALAQADGVDRTGALADAAQTVPNGLGGDQLGLLGGLERIVASGEVGGQGRGVGAAGAVGGSLGVALAGELDELLAVEEDVDGLLAVAAGDDDDLGAERVDGTGEGCLLYTSPSPRDS